MTEVSAPTPRAEVGSPPGEWMRRLTGPGGAAVLLALFGIFLLSSLRQASITTDELGHAVAGVSFWRTGDYRLDPENGNLPQRVMGLPLALAGTSLPSLYSDSWRAGDANSFGDLWLFHSGNDVPRLLFLGRAAMGLFAVALGAVVWQWSRRLFGPWGGLLSLVLYVLSPIVLANGGIMASDTAAAFGFLAAVGALARSLEKISAGRILAAGLCVGVLCVAKYSAVLIVPIAAVLVAVRAWDPRPLPLVLAGGRVWELRGGRRACALAAATLVQVLIAGGVIWACYGFRYAATTGADAGQDHFFPRWELALDQPDPLSLLGQVGLTAGQQAQVEQALHGAGISPDPWLPDRLAAFEGIRRQILTPVQSQRVAALLAAPPRAVPARVIDLLRRHRWLPEAFLYGAAHTWRFSLVRGSFLNGVVSLSGSPWFFPYIVLVKTPPAEFAIGAVALWAACRGPRRPTSSGFRKAMPLWTLVAVYAFAAQRSHFYLGNRHLLVIYAPLFVLAGAAAAGLPGAGPASRRRARVLLGLAACLAAEILYRYPHYIAYFNVFAGGPSQAYRHLVDSALDWGQDLPAVTSYLARHRPVGPVYFSYFGAGSPAYDGIAARRLPSSAGRDVPPAIKVVPVLPGEETALQQDPAYEVAGGGTAPDGRTTWLMLAKPAVLNLQGGLYLISATMLQPVTYPLDGPFGPWNDRYEATYQELRGLVRPLLDERPEVRQAALEERAIADWQIILPRFEQYRFARLTAFLRQRKPDDQINASILVYRLSQAQIAQAIEGPAPEHGPDVVRAFLAAHPR